MMLVLTECPNITDDLPLNIFFWARVVASCYITLPKNLTLFLIIYPLVPATFIILCILLHSFGFGLVFLLVFKLYLGTEGELKIYILCVISQKLITLVTG